MEKPKEMKEIFGESPFCYGEIPSPPGWFCYLTDEHLTQLIKDVSHLKLYPVTLKPKVNFQSLADALASPKDTTETSFSKIGKFVSNYQADLHPQVKKLGYITLSCRGGVEERQQCPGEA